ncbi:MAG TPA: hypothetical protein PLR37_10160 [Candidatus Accumulibacter phosphatis]|nr:hypothetical protein [Candidatus Accumulibacter phosphatis]
MKAQTEWVAKRPPKITTLNGLPSHLKSARALANLFGYSNHKLRRDFERQLRQHSVAKAQAAVSDDDYPVILYSEQPKRFAGFWNCVASARKRHKAPIEIARRRLVPELPIFLLEAWCPSFYESVAVGPPSAAPNLTAVQAAVDKAKSEIGTEMVVQMDLLALWPSMKEAVDAAGHDGTRPDETAHDRLAGAVFAMSCAYGFVGFMQYALDVAPEIFASFYADFIDPNMAEPDMIEPAQGDWAGLCAELKALSQRIESCTVSVGLAADLANLSGRFERFVAGYHKGAESIAAITAFFSEIAAEVEAREDTKWLAEDCRHEGECWLAGDILPDERMARLKGVQAAFATRFTEYVRLLDDEEVVEEGLRGLARRIASATGAERPALRVEERLLNDRKAQLSSALAECEKQLPQTFAWLGSDEPGPLESLPPQLELIDHDTPRPVASEPERSQAEPARPDPVPLAPPGTQQPQPAQAQTEVPQSAPTQFPDGPNQSAPCIYASDEVVELPGRQANPTRPDPVLPAPQEILQPEPAQLQTDVSQSRPAQDSGGAEQCIRRIHNPEDTVQLLGRLDRGETLVDGQGEAMASLQQTWLETRQPLRAWMLASRAEAHGNGLGATAESMLPAWVCRLLLFVTDNGLTITDEEAARFSTDLFGAAVLPEAQRELLVLWLAAELQRGNAKAVQVVRLAQPRKFDLPEHSLGGLCVRHLLAAVANGETLTPPPDLEVLRKKLEDALKQAKDLLNPARNNYQNARVKSFWRSMTITSGPLGQLLARAKEESYPAGTLRVRDLAGQLPEWEDIVASYRHNMECRIGEFVTCIEEARRNHNAIRAASHGAQATVSRKALGEIAVALDQRDRPEGWWFGALSAGVAAAR